MTKSLAAATAIALSLVATPSLALKFDFTQPGELGAGNTFNKGGVSGWVTASATLGTANVVQTGTGLGVGGIPDKDDAIDGGTSRDEILTFNFNSAVRLFSVTIADIDTDDAFGGDDWDVYVNGSLIANESGANPFLFDTTVDISSFGIGADDGSVFKDGDDVKVASFTVVPLPGALPLIATGAAFFGWAARRKRAT